MRKSPYERETELGIIYYAADCEGIGGKLRTVPEDFIVEELPINFTNTGPYTICRLTKKSWEHQHAVREITNRLHISPKRFGWAGTKDRNAVTTQYVSLYDVSKEQIEALSIKDITITPVASHQFSLGLGNLEGNRFRLTLRGCNADNLAEKTAEITAAVKTGIPNYFGLQRFGAMKPITHRMGYHILRGEFEEAVTLYVGDAFPYESDEIKAARARFRETKDAKEALHNLPVHLSYERIMLDSLMKKKDDFGAALQAIPPKLLSMFVSAYQSWLFNMAVSARCAEGTSFSEPRIGEHLVFANGRVDTVTEKNMPTAKQHMKRGRCFVVGWMPGKTLPVAAGPLENEMFALMEKDGISMPDFDKAAAFVKTNYDGFHRRISLEADVSYEISGDDVVLSFTLPPGHYATTVAREYMQAEPECMV
ncbi:MAG: tRNA pseudouridine(13) synthase TruD [Methanocorpusculum sp.]|nr:tRNA pseudouridine(13) synthase TruD [Methanocorpusculum sp.]